MTIPPETQKCWIFPSSHPASITYQHQSPGRHSAQSTFLIQLLFHVGLNKKKSTVCGLNNQWYCSWWLMFRKLEGSGSVMDLEKKTPTSVFQPSLTTFNVTPALSPCLGKVNWWRCIWTQERGALWPLENDLWVNLLVLVEHSLLTSGLRHSAVGWLHGRRPSCCQPPPSPPQNVGMTRSVLFACGSSFHR